MVSCLIIVPSGLIQSQTLEVYLSGLTPVGKLSKSMGKSSCSNSIGEHTKAWYIHQQKKMHAMQRRHKSPFKDHSEYVAKCLFVHVHAVLSQLWASFAEKTKIW